MQDPRLQPGFNDFVQRIDSICADLESLLSTANPTNDTVNDIFRGVHAVRGAAAFHGFYAIADLASPLESYLDSARLYVTSLSDELKRTITLFDSILKDWMEIYDTGRYEEQSLTERSRAFRKEIDALPPIFHEKEHEASDTKTESDHLKAAESLAVKRSIRVDAEKLDMVIDGVAEAVAIAAAIQQISHTLKNEYLEELSYRLGRLLNEVRTASQKLRMVPIESLFSRFSRSVYELSLKKERPVRLLIEGGDTPIDRNLLDPLFNAIEPLIVNAFIHGIESPAERTAAGKTGSGTITLSAKHRAGSVIIDVQDDGRGADIDSIRQTLKQTELSSDDETMSDEELLQIIVDFDFSKDRGMGAATRFIRSLNGEISVSSARGHGTTVRLIIPLTASSIDGFLMRIGRTLYAIPLEMVDECMEFRGGDSTVGEQNFIRVREEIIPFIKMDEFFEETSDRVPRKNLVIVHSGNIKAALVVDELLGRMHSMIKPAGDLFEGKNGISGFAVLGDGSTALIIDTSLLLNTVRDLSVEKTSALVNSALEIVSKTEN